MISFQSFNQTSRVDAIADAFLADPQNRPLVYHRSSWWEYLGTRYAERDPDHVEDRIRTWLRETSANPTGSLVANVARMVRAGVRFQGEQTPAWLGETRCDPTRVIAFRNGLLDLDGYLAGGVDGGLMHHTHEWFSTNVLPYDFAPEATCPTWLSFLGQVLRDDDQIRLAQEWCGYNLTQDNRFQKWLFCLGPSGSGKGTFLSVLEAVLGGWNVCGLSLQSLSGPHGTQILVGKQAALVSEIELGKDTKNLVQIMKAITGNDLVDINPKNRAAYSARLPARFTVAANKLPRLPDSSNALALRMLLLVFPVKYRGTDKEDPNLKDRLLAELPGVVNWSLEGLRSLYERGRFVQPEAGKAYLEEFKELSAPHGTFLEAYCDLAPGLFTATKDLYAAWRQFCVNRGYEPGSDSVFVSNLSAASDHQIKKRRLRNEEGRVSGYEGIGLNDAGTRLLHPLFAVA